MTDHRRSADRFEPTARRIRSMAARMLAELPVEDPDVVWARRAALLGETDGTPPGRITAPKQQRRGIWRWPR